MQKKQVNLLTIKNKHIKVNYLNNFVKVILYSFLLYLSLQNVRR